MSQAEDDEEIFINEEIHPFRDNPIIGIMVDLKNLNKRDKALVGSYLGHNVFYKMNQGEVPTLQDNIHNIVELAQALALHSHVITKTTANYAPGEKVDEIVIGLDFASKASYLFYGLYSSFLHANKHFIGFNIGDYPKSSFFKQLDSTQLKFGYDHTDGEKQIVFSQKFKPVNAIHTEYREELGFKKLCDNAQQIRRQTSLIFKKYLQDRSVFFPYHSFSDLQNYMFLQFGSKRFNYDVDTNKASKELLILTLHRMKNTFVKFGIINSDFENVLFEDGFTSELSFEHGRSLASSYSHLKSHYRRFMSFDPLLIQWHLKYDRIYGETKERLYLKNFKGIKDVGRKSYKNPDHEENANINKLPAGDPLGHKSILELGLKITSKNLPYFRMYSIENDFWTMRPFLF